MKKLIFILLFTFCIVHISAQASYEQYKKQIEYGQRYKKEQQQKFNKDLNKALSLFTKATNEYCSLVYEKKSISFVNENFPSQSNQRSGLHALLLSVSNSMNNEQLKIFQRNVQEYNNLYNNY